MSGANFFSPEQVAAILHVSPESVYGAIQRHELEADGRTSLISDDELAKYTRRGNPFAPSPTDEELVDRAQEGVYGAFGELEKYYRPKIRALCKFILGDPDEADDATQETLIKLFLNLHRIDSSRPPGPYIMQMAAHTCHDRLKSATWKVQEQQKSLEEPRYDDEGNARTLADELPALDPDPQERIEKTELWAAMHHCLGGLRPRERLAIWARFFEDETYREIAAELEVNEPGSAKYVVDQALKRLRDCLRDKGYEAI
jgi:RNA polymerase sigma-70 factor (ECF subfamily)